MVEEQPGGRENERLDTVHRVLAGPYRREVLRYLRTLDDDVASVDTLIDHVADREISANSRTRIAVRFRHVTLPKLADAGFIEYDARSATVRYLEDPLLAREMDGRTDVAANH